MPRPLVSSSATRPEALRLEQFIRDEGLTVEDVMAPASDEKVTAATVISHKDRRRLEEFARRRGVTPSVIIRTLIYGRLRMEERSG